MKIIMKLLVVLICIIFIAAGCKKNYLEKYPLSGPSDASFYTNQDELMMGLMGCYRTLNFNINATGVEAGGPWPLMLECTTDLSWTRIANSLQSIANGSHDVNNAFSLGFWRDFYISIGRCNFLLDNISKLEGKVDAKTLAQVKAEARFLRAIQYHYLTEMFGDVPLITKTQTLSEAQVPRNAKTEVVDFIIKELTEAEPDLPLNQEIINNGRGTKGAALGFLARTALYNGKWDVAAATAQKVMTLNKYELHNNYANLFRYSGKTNKEVLISLQYLRGFVTHTTPRTQGPRLIGGVCTVVPYQSTVDAFEATDGLTIDKSPLFNPAKPFDNRDPRLGYSVVLPGTTVFGYNFQPHRDSLTTWNYNTSPATRIANTDATNAFATFTGYLWRKYLDEGDLAFIRDSELGIALMRYAEILLIYAEAKIEANQIDNSVYTAINAVRQRPGVNMPAIPAGKSQAELRVIVRKERIYELANEGLRLFDIRRWKIAESVMNGPFYGKPPKAFLANAPVIDQNGRANYTNVTNKADLRLIETKAFAARDYLWPIPGIEILTNTKITQNSGY